MGSMGGPMASNTAARFGSGALVAHRLLLMDLRAGVADELAARYPRNVSAAASLEELAGVCDLIVLSLPDGQVVQETVAALAKHLEESKQMHRLPLVVDTSTTSPEVAREAAAKLDALAGKASGIDGLRGGFLDAPVTGTPSRARTGTLTAMVGGEGRQVAQASLVLETFAERVLHMGAVGNGQIAKAMNNCLYNVSCAAMAEMLPLAARAGLPLETFVEAVSMGTGQSFGFGQWAPRVLSREFEAPAHGYPMGSAFKDLETLAAVASEHGLQTPPVVAAARGTYERALAMGLRQEHKGAMVKVFERELGVVCRPGIGSDEGRDGPE